LVVLQASKTSLRARFFGLGWFKAFFPALSQDRCVLIDDVAIEALL
jgi:hypothetical protein